MEAEISHMAEPLTLTGKFSPFYMGATCMGATFIMGAAFTITQLLIHHLGLVLQVNV